MAMESSPATSVAVTEDIPSEIDAINDNIALLQKELTQVTQEKKVLLKKVKELVQLEEQLNEKLQLEERRRSELMTGVKCEESPGGEVEEDPSENDCVEIPIDSVDDSKRPDELFMWLERNERRRGRKKKSKAKLSQAAVRGKKAAVRGKKAGRMRAARPSIKVKYTSVAEEPDEQSSFVMQPKNLIPILPKPAVISENELGNLQTGTDQGQTEGEAGQTKKSFEILTYDKKPCPKQPITCDRCKKEFVSRQAMLFHMCTAENVFKCSECTVQYSCMLQLKKHMRVHTHPEEAEAEARSFVCPLCGKYCYNYPRYKLHMRVHTGEKPFLCKECGKTFVHKQSFVSHQKQHAGDLQHLCNVCGKCVADKHKLKKHLVSHTKPFKCEVCGQSFSKRNTLRTHQQTHSSGLTTLSTVALPQADPCSHLCDKCDKRYRHAHDLRKHIKQHHGGLHA